MERLFDTSTAATPKSAALPGCRLRRLEVFNWGTFDQKVWTFDVDGRNALLTGDIGSGKSTLVDAITTLLLPAHRISYNKAAGADTRERDLRSYVFGYYKSERNETTGTSRPVALRDTSSYSVVLGVFANAGYGETVTVAQVFQARDPSQGQPDRFYVVADGELSIAKDFSDFGSEIVALRRKLRACDARLYDTFPDYGKDFRRRLGIESEQAMDLFLQTVSMKAVDNLNDFVRVHMLEPFDTKVRIESLVDHFDNLTRAHDAVLRARAQLDLLEPLVGDLDTYDARSVDIQALDHLHGALPYYFAQQTRSLLEVELERLAARISELDREIADANVETDEWRAVDAQLNVQIAGCGGDRLAAIETSIKQHEQEQPRRRKKFDRFNELLREAGLDEVTVAEQFNATRARLEHRDTELQDRIRELDNELTERRHELRTLDDEAMSVNAELRSLESRQSNIPRRSLELRDALCGELGIDAAALPYVGELIQVRADARDWEGAAERVLRGFALSLLVHDTHYDQVAAWIDARHLSARAVYFRVPARSAPVVRSDKSAAQPVLRDVLKIKPGSEFTAWLASELDRRANHLCVDSVAELRGAEKAVTRNGQIKDKNRHEKDDRHRVDDRREYVLGWTNEQKIDALVAHATRLQATLAMLHTTVNEAEGNRKAVDEQLKKLFGLREQTNWDELDWQALVARISELRAEEQRIRSSSNELDALSNERDDVQGELTTLQKKLDALQRERGGAETEQKTAESQLTSVDRLLTEGAAATAATEWFASIDEFMSTATNAAITDLSSVRDAQESVNETIRARKDELMSKQSSLGIRVVRAMGAFRVAYPQETAELDDSLASAVEYRTLHARVATDDLPRFEHEFKQYLNQNTIREIAGFSAQLNKQEELIRERVETINESLRRIDYNDDRYIRLVPDRTPNTEIREFREELRGCTDNIIGTDDSDQYSEQRFLQVKHIIDRFKGREGSVDQDRNWMRRVTDVRQWFVFSASERWRSNDSEYEHYTDSAGKSGGQKEKLAYTILAASLAYQFRLDFGTTRSKAFRFVAIDEAFGRGSEVSTRYALNLFTSLGLQLLIVTPLQKIHVIEPHVSAVGFVDNLNGSYSRLQCLTVEEYRRRRRQHNTG
ncbi:MAG: ATP-binding protein [Actinomycetota bacterium]